MRDLKDQPVGPTGRTMTLDEIAHALDSLEGTRIAGKMDSSLGPASLSAEFREEEVSTLRSPGRSARDYLRSVRESLGLRAGRDEDDRVLEEQVFARRYSLAHAYEEPDDSGNDLRDLLGRLQALLAELGSDTRFTKPQGEAGQWLRVTTPDVELHVRKPDDHVARARLSRLARALARLLEREE